MARRIRALRETNPMLGTRGCRLGLLFPEIFEMQVRAIIRLRRGRAADGRAPLVEIMHPLVGFAEELKRLRELTVRTAAEEEEADYLCGTMIELPRACVRADEIAAEADFFSFGTNDLTQTTLGFSRDDAEKRFLSHYLDEKILATIRSRRSTRVGWEISCASRSSVRVSQARHQARDLRRARRRSALGRLLPRARARLRELLLRIACRSRAWPRPRLRWPRPA